PVSTKGVVVLASAVYESCPAVCAICCAPSGPFRLIAGPASMGVPSIDCDNGCEFGPPSVTVQPPADGAAPGAVSNCSADMFTKPAVTESLWAIEPSGACAFRLPTE